MTESDFIKKWADETVPAYWRNTASEVYWIRAYKMEEATLLAMSHDLIFVFELSDIAYSSSIEAAAKIIGCHDLL